MSVTRFGSHFPSRSGDAGGKQPLKRAVDLTLVVVTAPLTLPVLLAAVLCVWIFDGRPVLFRQDRCGLHGRRFALLKLRTMTVGRDDGITVSGDPRITSCGRILRWLKLDELPQLWNVLTGDMSLVGPRPELPRWVDRYPQEFNVIQTVRPGLTDFASICYRDEAGVIQRLVARGVAPSGEAAYSDFILPDKLLLNRRYLERRRLTTDFAVMAATLYAVVSGRVPIRLITSISGVLPQAWDATEGSTTDGR
jgi:lipopolysaccharide/colanic/teichoic acid biosynthesis glycosyltransferase